MTFDNLRDARVFVAGHRGMVGSALVRRLVKEDCTVLSVDRRSVDLREASSVARWMERERPDIVFLAAAKVGGILANVRGPVNFLLENLQIQNNVIESSFRCSVKKLVFLGSSCIYPKAAPQPIPESALLTGPLEPTNEWYALAKIAGLKLCSAYRKQYGADFISLMPTNLYGPNDNFDLETSHVVPALMRKIHDAKMERRPEVVVWGSGTPRREFLHVDDMADASIFLAGNYSGAVHVNIGHGSDVSIRELAETLAEIIGWTGSFTFDTSRPDGTPRKLLDVSKLSALGWRPQTPLIEGLASTYDWYMKMTPSNGQRGATP
jgi:GDP-L-fucose synthase